MYSYSSSYQTGYAIGYIIGGIVVSIIFGLITKHINESKGYTGGFAWGFWLNVIGIIVVACKPDNRYYEQREYQPMYPQAQEPEKTWRCSSCGHENSDKLNYCLRCRSDRYEVESVKVICPHCGATNNKKNRYCFACNKSLSEEKEPPVIKSPEKNSSPDDTVIKLIKQLAELHTQGILTDEEFETKKAELLAKM